MSDFNNHRVLIVDDNPAIHMDFKRILGASRTDDIDRATAELFGESLPDTNDTGFELTFCSQGGEAVEAVVQAAAAGKPFAVAFVDMRMPPGIDGVDTISLIWEADPNVHAIICTAYSDRSWSEMIQQLGLTDRFLVLKKPFDPSEVWQLTAALVRKWSLARQTEIQFQEMQRLIEGRARELKSRRPATAA